MRYILFSLGRTLSERISAAAGGNCVECPTLQRLATLRCRKDDIIIAHAAALTQRDVFRTVHGHRSMIVFSQADEIKEHEPPYVSGYTVFLGYDFTEDDLRNAMKKASGVSKVFGTVGERLVGSSVIMAETRRRIEKAAASRMPVHITGETGTGKTLAAEEIHRYSSVKEMIRESCGILSSGIAESEIFGHRKGAFSGASSDREGLIAEADGSTLFLDEVQDLSLEMQSKLLRVIETGEYRPLGSDKVRHSSFRLITASSVGLKTLVEEKRMRRDFYYRIGFMNIRMPSLSEHMEDIPELIGRFEEENGYEKRISDFSPFMHDYPGNVRELYREVMVYHQENG